MSESTTPTQRAIEAVWRIEAPRLIGRLVRLCRDVSFAEDAAHEALVSALEQWPQTGVPENPGAWLMTTAKNSALDQLRRHSMAERKHDELAAQLTSTGASATDEAALDEGGGDDVLRLMLVACHPLLAQEARAALTLKLLGGLTTAEIARAFLSTEATIAQRIVRAKRTLSEAHVPFEIPQGPEMLERVPSILEVVYLIFNEGYSATAGDDWMRPQLCQDAMRLGRILAARVPEQAEVHGLVALMELQASRMRARISKSGDPVLLLDQNRAHWDHTLIQHGLASLQRAQRLSQPLGSYTLQAAIAGCHARATTAEQTDWHRIVALYDALVSLTGSPVVELNRAVAVAMAFGPEQGLELVDTLVSEGALDGYHHLFTVRGDLLEKLGRRAEARSAFERALALTNNARERSILQQRIRLIAPSGVPS
jgi:RNA polymerase sigma factor (sigma-70 family)